MSELDKQVQEIFTKYHSGKIKVEPQVALDIGFLAGAYMRVAPKPKSEPKVNQK